MSETRSLPKKKIERKNLARAIAVLEMFALQLLFVPLPASGAARRQEARQPLGSLNTVGEVYLNDSAAPAEGTIFAGDVLRTGAQGTAAFTPSGKGSLKISPGSQVVFAGAPQYLAELKAGTAVMSSASGAAGVSLKAGNFVVAAVTEGEQSTVSVASAADGSFEVTCLEGSVGVLPMEGGSGVFLQAGQAEMISPQGELAAKKEPETPAKTPAAPAGVAKVKKNNTAWIILALAGGAAAAGGAALGGKGGGGGSSSSISPAVP